MIRLETIDVQGFGPAIHGMRNPKNSWDRGDSIQNPDGAFALGDNDRKLALQLAAGGPVHAKYRRMITVWVDITAPLYWWKEFDTYKVGTAANSCSTMHKIHAKEFVMDDFSHEHMTAMSEQLLVNTIKGLNWYRGTYLVTKSKRDWWQMIQLLPSSYNQKRTVLLNYEVLASICKHRAGHKLDEWHEFIGWAKTLPYPELFMEASDEHGDGD